MFDIDFSKSVDLELDFDLGDFDVLSGTDIPAFGAPQERIVKPKIDINDISHTVCYSNAEEFARQISLEPDETTYAWVNGNFVMGDILPALITARGVNPKCIYISTLSLSIENIEAWSAIMAEAKVERFVLLCSAFFLFTREK